MVPCVFFPATFSSVAAVFSFAASAASVTHALMPTDPWSVAFQPCPSPSRLRPPPPPGPGHRSRQGQRAVIEAQALPYRGSRQQRCVLRRGVM